MKNNCYLSIIIKSKRDKNNIKNRMYNINYYL